MCVCVTMGVMITWLRYVGSYCASAAAFHISGAGLDRPTQDAVTTFALSLTSNNNFSHSPDPTKSSCIWIIWTMIQGTENVVYLCKP